FSHVSSGLWCSVSCRVLFSSLLLLLVVSWSGFRLFRYLGSTARTFEMIQEDRPIAHARLSADQATLVSVQAMVRAHHAQNGQWPADKAAVLTLLQSPPRFQCAGNDFEYDPVSGDLRLLIADAARC